MICGRFWLATRVTEHTALRKLINEVTVKEWMQRIDMVEKLNSFTFPESCNSHRTVTGSYRDSCWLV